MSVPLSEDTHTVTEADPTHDPNVCVYVRPYLYVYGCKLLSVACGKYFLVFLKGFK